MFEGETLLEILRNESAKGIVRAILLVGAGWLLARLLRSFVRRAPGKLLDPQASLLLQRFVFYAVFALFITSALHEFGFQLSVLLGAAGVLTIAIGFASQTSASNLVSGLFLIGETPFEIGDVIKVGDTTGEVLSIDLLAAKLRTFDNLYVRIPNETLIKSQITNLTRFPIRRIDLQLGVAYKEDLGKVQKILFEVADRNPLCLDEPKPLVIFTGFGDSAITFQFSIWSQRQSFLALRNAIYLEIKAAFDAADVEIPFPHRSLYTGSITHPFPVRLVADPAPLPAST